MRSELRFIASPYAGHRESQPAREDCRFAPKAERAIEPGMDGATNTDFTALLNREIVRSERRRMLSLAAVFAVILALALALRALVPGFTATIFHGPVPWQLPISVFTPFIAYELLAAGLLTWLERRGRAFPRAGRFVNTLIETSFPTVLIYLLAAEYIDPPAAFVSWPSYLYFLFIVLSTMRLDFVLSAFTGVVAAVESFVLAYFVLHLTWRADDFIYGIGFHLTRSVVLLGAGLLAGTVGVTVKSHFRRALDAASTRDRVTNLFGQHVSPQVVDRLLAIGAAELSEMRRVCVMFVDIRGFTAAAAQRTPDEVVARLDDAFAVLVEIVDRYHGIVNKFLGDGFLAMFGAPIDDPAAAADAVAAGREMLPAIAASNAGHAWPIRIGIGIHIGDAVTGTVGSPRRKEYTVIGDTVNLASRLESLNKEVGSQFLVSDAVRVAAGDSLGEAQSLGPVAIRGYERPVTVWRLDED
jgi:adenylate cyclase